MNGKNRFNSLCFKAFMIAFMVILVFSVAVCPCVSADTAWSRTYGGVNYDRGSGETFQTSDGGYIVSGDTNSSGAGGLDFWLFRTDAMGNMLWDKTYGGVEDETIGEMCRTSDGGYALAGGTYSYGAGDQDVWLVKTDASGNKQWSKTYGGTGSDYGFSVAQANDGGYVIFGVTE